MTRAKRKKLKEGELLTLVAERYPSPEWAFLRQVRSGTGYANEERYADGIALNLWPSRGMELHGFEVKSRRSDWLKELKDPEKSCAIQGYCDRWWIVVDSEAVVKKGELPPTWGLMVADQKGAKIVVEVEAPKLEPTALDRAFIASVLRNTAKLETSTELLKEARVAGRKSAQEQQENAALKSMQQQVTDLTEAITEFERTSGIMISKWNAGQIGNAVRMLGMAREMTKQRFERERSSLTNLVDGYDAAIAELQGGGRGDECEETVQPGEGVLGNDVERAGGARREGDSLDTRDRRGGC